MRKTKTNSGALRGTVASRRGVRGAWTCVAAAGLIGGCGGGGDEAKPAALDRLDWSQAAALARAQTCDDALATFRAAARTEMELELANSRRCVLDLGGCVTYAGGDGLPVTLSPDNGEAAGIDALDRVKTDGTHIYMIYGAELVVLTSWPASATAVVARVALPAGDQRGLYLAGTNVVALTAVESAEAVAARKATGWPRNYELPRPDVTIASVFDVSNPSAPVVTARKGFGGNLVASRRVDGRVFLALTARVEVPGLHYVPTDRWEIAPEALEAAFEEVHASNVAAIDAVTIDSWLPRSVAIGEDGSVGERGAPLNGCTDVYATNLHAGSGFMTIATVDVTSGETLGASTIAGEWNYAVASRDALYLAGLQWDNWLYAEEADEALETQIHKFALTDSVARYAASGKVAGWMRSEYAMDEYGGTIRVATEAESSRAPDPVIWESRVTVLAEEDGVLVERGVVAENEQGHSLAGVHFVGNMGFAAASDGLLDVLDLSDASAPTIAGTADLGGGTSYLQALDAGHVLAVGPIKNGAGEGWGLQLAIVDVSDPRAPTVTQRETIERDLDWTAYEVFSNALRWVAERSLFLMPIVYPRPEANGHRSELLAYRVTPSGLTPLGAASHADLLDALVGGPVCNGSRLGVGAITRSVVIDDFVYSFSSLGVAVHDTRALDGGAVAEAQLVDETLAATWAEALRCPDGDGTGEPDDGTR